MNIILTLSFPRAGGSDDVQTAMFALAEDVQDVGVQKAEAFVWQVHCEAEVLPRVLSWLEEEGFSAEEMDGVTLSWD